MVKKSQNRELKKEKVQFPRITISALRGSSAKTIISLGIINALRKKDYKIIPYKKGPDYIDAAWLSKAAGTECRHLDLYLMKEKGVQEVFYRSHELGAISIIEGNRGLFDGIDIYGTYSTAKIAKLLDVPIVLIVDCTKATNTIASLVLGVQTYDPDIPLKGVILNRIAGKRHSEVIKKSIEHHTNIPIVGEIPNLDIKMPERHLGLTTVYETGEFNKKLDYLGDIAEQYLDLDKILQIAISVPKVTIPDKSFKKVVTKASEQKINIGIIRDPAFQFYYTDNLEALEKEGGNIRKFNSMKDNQVNDVDILYIAGGFPEVHAKEISENKKFRDSIKRLADAGIPIYGECGAVIYLGNSVDFKGKKYEMCGVFPLDFALKTRPVGHGYSNVEVDVTNPFFPKGTKFKGHEFHYSYPINWKADSMNTAFQVHKGHGLDGDRDGLFKNNVFVTYTHVISTGSPEWARRLIESARKVKYGK